MSLIWVDLASRSVVQLKHLTQLSLTAQFLKQFLSKTSDNCQESTEWQVFIDLLTHMCVFLWSLWVCDNSKAQTDDRLVYPKGAVKGRQLSKDHNEHHAVSRWQTVWFGYMYLVVKQSLGVHCYWLLPSLFELDWTYVSTWLMNLYFYTVWQFEIINVVSNCHFRGKWIILN